MAKFPLPYDFSRSYYWNFANGPKRFRGRVSVPKVNPTTFMGFGLNSPFGIAAGPLLNSRWVSYFARLGYDILTYKTVRSGLWPCNPLYNIRYVRAENGVAVYEKGKRTKTITNSFGIPSFSPEFWKKDIVKARKLLKPGQILIGSAVGSQKQRPLVEDFAYVSKMVSKTPVHIVEINLSCPNVRGEGILCENPAESREVIKAVRLAIGKKPLLVKIGVLPKKKLHKLLEAIAEYAQGVVAINSIPHKTKSNGKTYLIGGRPVSGVCGEDIKPHAVQALKDSLQWKKQNNAKISVISVGGILTPEDIEERLTLGADAAQCATAALLNCGLAIQYKKLLSKG